VTLVSAGEWDEALRLVKRKFHLARSRHVSTRSTCGARRDERVEPCCLTSST